MRNPRARLSRNAAHEESTMDTAAIAITAVTAIPAVAITAEAPTVVKESVTDNRSKNDSNSKSTRFRFRGRSDRSVTTAAIHCSTSKMNTTTIKTTTTTRQEKKKRRLFRRLASSTSATLQRQQTASNCELREDPQSTSASISLEEEQQDDHRLAVSWHEPSELQPTNMGTAFMLPPDSNTNNNHGTLPPPKIPPLLDTAAATAATAIGTDKVNAPSVPISTTTEASSCATVILQHSYLEYMLCGSGGNGNDGDGGNGGDYDTVATTDHGEDGAQHSLHSGSSSNDNNKNNSRHGIPDDPTVQESIECVFSSQLEQGLSRLLLDDDEYDNDDKNDQHNKEQVRELVAPSVLQQSLLKNRSDARFHSDRSTPRTRTFSSLTPRNAKKKQTSVSLHHVGTHDPRHCQAVVSSGAAAIADTRTLTDARRVPNVAGDCPCRHQRTPVSPVAAWPQRPLLLRPTPDSGTRVRGVRFSSTPNESEDAYLWKASANDDDDDRGAASTSTTDTSNSTSTPTDNAATARNGSTVPWPESLRQHWNSSQIANDGGTSKGINRKAHAARRSPAAVDVMCSQCMMLPINNGNEEPGQALVTDFESDLFQGSLMVRIRYAEGTTAEPYNDEQGYFAGMNRRYQVVVRGKFKKPVPFTECLSGFALERKCGKLPPKFIVRGALKVVSFFAPQLAVKAEGPKPTCLTPFGSTPHAIIVKDDTSQARNTLSMEDVHEEPTQAAHTLLGEALGASSSAMQRSRFRKKAFDKLFVQKNKNVLADTDKVYTFEFLQHLFNFQDFTIELGSLLGPVQFKEVLDGQPLQILAMHGDQKLWSFDVWHECLVGDAKRYDNLNDGR